MVKPKSKQKSFEWRDLFEGSRKWFFITPACLLLMGAMWWGYKSLTTLPPPDPKKATPEDLVTFVGSERGLYAMSVPSREQWLVRTWGTYAEATPEQRAQLMQAMSQMSPSQEQMYARAVAGVVKARVMDGARQFNSQPTAAARSQFAQNFYNDFKRFRAQVTGANLPAPKAGGGPGVASGGGPGGAPAVAPGFNPTKPLADAAPKTGEQIQAAIVSESTPHERSQADKFIEQLAELHKQDAQQLARGGR